MIDRIHRLPPNADDEMRRVRAAQAALEARALLDAEAWDEAVQAELKRLRAQRGRSLWQRLIDKLPFTIIWRNR